MSLPWRFSTIEDYVEGTIQNLRRHDDDDDNDCGNNNEDDENNSKNKIIMKKKKKNNMLTTQHQQQLNIGKYYLHGPDLQSQHLISIFEEAAKKNSSSSSSSSSRSSCITDISFSGITMDREEVLPSLNLMLKSFNKRHNVNKNNKNKLKRISFNSCSGCGIEALAATAAGEEEAGEEEAEDEEGIPLVECIRIVDTRMTNVCYNSLGRHVELSNVLTQLELFELKFEGSAHLQNLALGLKTTKSLKLLEMSYCTFDDDAINELSRNGLVHNRSLESFFLPGCELEDHQITTFVTSLSNHPTLQHLKLFRNYCGSNGASKVAEILDGGEEDDETTTSTTSTKTKLKSLDLSYQQYERADKLDITLISKSLSSTNNTSCTLTILKLSFNKLNDNDAIKLATGLSTNNTLQELDLRANNIRNEGIVAIAEYIIASKSTSLLKLFLFGNPISNPAANALLNGIRDNNTTLQVLNIDYCTLWYNIIQFYTYVNRAGRGKIQENINPALWPIILGERANKISAGSLGVCTHSDLIFQLLVGFGGLPSSS